VVHDHREYEDAAGNVDASGDFPMHSAWAHLLEAAAWQMFHTRERRTVGSQALLRLVLTRAYISFRRR
jgi:hypothetical protein